MPAKNACNACLPSRLAKKTGKADRQADCKADWRSPLAKHKHNAKPASGKKAGSSKRDRLEGAAMPILSCNSVKATVRMLLLAVLFAELLAPLPVEAVVLSCPAVYAAVAIAPKTWCRSNTYTYALVS